MKTRFRLPLAVLVLAAPLPLLAQSARDFQLPPAPTPTATPNVQGPVDTESGTVPVRPRAIPTARPAPAPTATPTATPQPTATATPTPRAAQPRPAASPAARTATLPRPTPTASPRPTEPRIAPTPPVDRVPLTPPEPVLSPEPTATQVPTAIPQTRQTAAPADLPVEEPAADEARGIWPFLLPTGLIALAGAAFFAWRRRRPMVSVPQIERPVVAPSSQRATLADIRLNADALKLTRSMAFATLDYQVTLLNRARSAAQDMVLSADLVTAHGDAPMESQIASADQPLEQRHVFARIAPGQTVRHEGKLQFPLREARIIRQGSAALMVPLLRVRLDAEGEQPIVKTFVVGQGIPGGGRVAPFRLDEGPRSYSPVAARALD